jgi:hypothetical protein
MYLFCIDFPPDFLHCLILRFLREVDNLNRAQFRQWGTEAECHPRAQVGTWVPPGIWRRVSPDELDGRVQPL